MGCNAIDPIRAARNPVRVAPPTKQCVALGFVGLGQGGYSDPTVPSHIKAVGWRGATMPRNLVGLALLGTDRRSCGYRVTALG